MKLSDHQSADELEIRVQERTAELEKANQALRAEIFELKQAEKVLRQGEQHIRLKSESILSPALEVANLELAEIIDVQVIQFLMDDFYKLTHIPMGLNDLKGKVLAGIGWQDICTRFHRVHPEAFKHCLESDIKLSVGVSPGKFKLFKCKNNVWDISTPIMIGDQQVGILFAGQFFFDDEPLDYELFQSQAKIYGFNEEEYIAALEKVPRLSRETVDTGMAFLTKLANMISQLSYSNIKLVQSLEERDSLMDALLESEKRERARSDELAAVLDAVPAAVWIAHDPGALKITGNRLSYEWLRLPEGANVSKAAPEGRPETYKLFKDGVEIPLSDMPVRMAASGKEVSNYEFDIVSPDGTMRHLLGNAKSLRDGHGNSNGSISAFIDITERKRAEATLAFERSQLLSIFDGIDDVVYVTDPFTYEVLYANKAMKEKFGGELVGGICYREFQRRDSPCDFCTNPIILKEKDKPYHWEYYNPSVDLYFMIMDRIIKWPDGRDVRFEIAKDITESKKAEEALKKAHDNLEKLVEERTKQLETAYNRLKESEKGLAEAQRMAHIGNWSWDITTNELFWSDEVYRIFGLNPQEFKVTYDLVLTYVHPEDLDHLINAINEGLNGRPCDVDYRIILADGEERIVHTEAEIIFYEENVPVQAKGIVQDITERKKAEEKIKTLANALESSDDAIVTKSLEGIITSWNRGAEQIYGYSAEEILGKDISILEPANLKGELKQLIETIKQGERVKHYETLRLKKDGTLINASVTLSPIFDSSGELVAISAIARDITERIKAEKTLVEMDKIRIKEIHHRIKNNLQVISSLLDLQAEKFQDKEVLEAFRESQSRVLSMSLIHEELYKGDGTDNVNFSVYLQKLADNLFQTYSLGSKNIRLYMDLEENAFFNMDTAVPLGIIVNELVSNSLKHAFTEKEGDVRVRLCREEKNHEISKPFFSLTISDNGKGIPENIELESVESLGLQLVNILIDQLDGNIELKREQGTEFRITFNVAERP